jgi:hypothetical protein
MPTWGRRQADRAREEDRAGGQEDTEADALHDRENGDPAGHPRLRDHLGRPGSDCPSDRVGSHERCHLVASASAGERGTLRCQGLLSFWTLRARQTNADFRAG